MLCEKSALHDGYDLLLKKLTTVKVCNFNIKKLSSCSHGHWTISTFNKNEGREGLKPDNIHAQKT